MMIGERVPDFRTPARRFFVPGSRAFLQGSRILVRAAFLFPEAARSFTICGHSRALSKFPDTRAPVRLQRTSLYSIVTATSMASVRRPGSGKSSFTRSMAARSRIELPDLPTTLDA